MLMSLLSFDALLAFDAVYGASAGAINATYFLTGAAQRGGSGRCSCKGQPSLG